MLAQIVTDPKSQSRHWEWEAELINYNCGLFVWIRFEFEYFVTGILHSEVPL